MLPFLFLSLFVFLLLFLLTFLTVKKRMKSAVRSDGGRRYISPIIEPEFILMLIFRKVLV